MIPVEQRYPYDCMRACLASVFECDYEEAPNLTVPETGEPVEQWLRVMTLWLHDRGFHPQNFDYNGGHGERPLRSPWYWPGYWLGSVWSPRFTEPDGSPGAHSVVMFESEIAWDPHPDRKQGHLGFFGADVFMPLNPAALVLVSPSSAVAVSEEK